MFATADSVPVNDYGVTDEKFSFQYASGQTSEPSLKEQETNQVSQCLNCLARVQRYFLILQ